MMTNIRENSSQRQLVVHLLSYKVRFSPRPNSRTADMNPLILLYGKESLSNILVLNSLDLCKFL
jgi:hypothetical protein